MQKKIIAESKELTVSGSLVKTARLSAEGYEFVEDPKRLADEMRSLRVIPDVLTFTDPLSATAARFDYYSEPESLAVLEITDYETWWKRQINDKTRNMVRKAGKKGVVIRRADFDDALIAGIKRIHDEHPLRQGKPFKHYGKSFDQVKADHASYLDRSDFVGAYYNDELIGIIKLVHSNGWSNLMQIISMISHRDKAPTNALLAKAVEICAEKGVPKLQYGIWSSRGIGDFKLHHDFKRIDVARYYVPLSSIGKLVLRLKLHRGVPQLLPKSITESLVDLRSKLYSFKYRNHTFHGAVA